MPIPFGGAELQPPARDSVHEGGGVSAHAPFVCKARERERDVIVQIAAHKGGLRLALEHEAAHLGGQHGLVPVELTEACPLHVCGQLFVEVDLKEVATGETRAINERWRVPHDRSSKAIPLH